MSSKPIGVLRFLGTNCDRDLWQGLEWMGAQPKWLWYADHFSPDDFSGFVVPGGFSYGDYLRCGALAARSPAMQSLREADKKGMPILGICNGFQILCEAQMLPGALLRNESRRFVDRWVSLKLVNKSVWNKGHQEVVQLPVAHGEGRFYAPTDTIKKIWDNNQVWWTYQDNPNGSLDDIAGVRSSAGNVCALMPHPERAVRSWMGGENGTEILACGVGL